MSDTERMEVIKQIKRQKFTHDCPKCTKPTYCSMEAGKSASACWCMGINTLDKVVDIGEVCYCRDCLTEGDNQ